VDPFLRLLNKTVAGSTTRAFADDIGSVIPKISDLPLLHSSFHLFEKSSGLALNPPKCTITPFGNASYSRNHRPDQSVPQKGSFVVLGDLLHHQQAEYLGFMIGPDGGNDASWEKPLKNYKNRVSTISKARLPPSIGTDLYTVKAFAVNSYIPQLCKPISAILKEETMPIQKVLHLPHNTLPKLTPFCLQEAGWKSCPVLPLHELLSKRVQHGANNTTNSQRHATSTHRASRSQQIKN
jgi:hypothetical protein